MVASGRNPGFFFRLTPNGKKPRAQEPLRTLEGQESGDCI